MRREYLFVLGFFALLGVFFIRGGITGYAVAENCYSGDCSYQEKAYNPSFISSEDSHALSIIGFMLITISLAMTAGYANWHKNRELSNDKQTNNHAL